MASPLDEWDVLTNGAFDASGQFSLTNSAASVAPERYFILQLVP